MRHRGLLLPPTDAGGTLFRLVCTYRPYYPDRPYDDAVSRTKVGTGFLLLFRKHRLVVVTAHHVVSNHVSVVGSSEDLANNGEPVPLCVLGYHSDLDVAFLALPEDALANGGRLRPFRVGASSRLRPGDDLEVRGFAGATLRTHHTYGAVSGRTAWSDNRRAHNRIQTDAPVNGGNSGGPVLRRARGRADGGAEEEEKENNGEDQAGVVVGVVTTGENDMENTNYFCGTDELCIVANRILMGTKGTTTSEVACDRGFVLNAALRPVSAAACVGEAGGALVVGVADPDDGLNVGDVLVGVRTPDGDRVDVDATMRVRVPSVWQSDAVDLRALLDTFVWKLGEPDARWDVWVRRRHGGEEEEETEKERLVRVRVGPNALASRRQRPDCELVTYVSVGGLVCQTRSVSHDERGNDNTTVDHWTADPEREVASEVIVTHVEGDSPFAKHDSGGGRGLLHRGVSAVHLSTGERVETPTLFDLADALCLHHQHHKEDEDEKETTPPPVLTVLELRTGHRFGATADEVRAYVPPREALRDGLHEVTRRTRRSPPPFPA